MRLDDIVLIYQKKIGSYDKQQWEKTLEEQKIIENTLNLPLRNTKLKTDLIDVDLVRGSTFPKAKPKQSLLTVLYLSFLRYFFLPVYSRWWVEQTSPLVFVLLLSLYLLQMTNWSIYSYSLKHFKKDEDEGSLPLSEILVPMSLSLVLCFIHSQIVATTSTSNRTTNKRREKSFKLCRKGSDKMSRRKKKPLRQRPSTIVLDSKIPNILDSDEDRLLQSRRKPTLKFPLEQKNVQENCEILPSPEAPSTSSTKRRNVNWESPVRHALQPNESNPLNLRRRRFSENVNGDDGFESFTGKSSSGEDNLKEREQSRREKESDSEIETPRNSERSTPVKKCIKKLKDSSDTDEENNEEVESPSPTPSSQHFETTDGEYIGVTSNSESECSVDHSGCDEQDDLISPTTILSPNDSKEKVSCTIWTKNEAKKAELSVLDISVEIIKRVELIPETCDYVYIGLILSVILSLIPTYCRLCDVVIQESNSTSTGSLLDLPKVFIEDTSISQTLLSYYHIAFGETSWEKTFLIISTFQRLLLSFFYFFLMAVAERTFKERFLFAKLFSHLTSSRRARKSSIPHFRLNKVRNIKAWLCVRSYLKRLGPQRSVDVIVSAAFITTLLLLAFLCLEFLKDADHMHSQMNLEALMWSCALGTFMLRFMTLGTKINKKYRSISVLITEQINLYVQIEQKPHKKEELGVANSVLKLASDLLKELDSPFKISGLSANSYLYNTVKVVVLSALSGVLSEMLGFKLKLHKIKIK